MSNIKLFESRKIRATWHEAEQKWHFSVADVVEALTDSSDVKQYVKRMRQRDSELNSYWGTVCTPLGMIAADGKGRQVQCANVEGLLRIIQSIPSPKAEPFKRWLATVGYEHLEEISKATFGLTPSEYKELPEREAGRLNVAKKESQSANASSSTKSSPSPAKAVRTLRDPAAKAGIR